VNKNSEGYFDPTASKAIAQAAKDEQLKPCPKCGSTRVTLTTEAGTCYDRLEIPHCEKCGFNWENGKAQIFYTEKEAVEWWNSMKRGTKL
jgi:DNA-directed RNA polymerase subunit M/transcription elongation factor TFIIS